MTVDIITVGVDGSPSSKDALVWAEDLAARTGARVQAIMAWKYPLTAFAGTWGAAPAASQMQEIAEDNLAAVVAEVAGDGAVERVVCQGGASKCLNEASRESALLVVGRRGVGGFAGTGLGSTSHHSALHASCSVAIVGDEVKALPADPTVVVAIDGSENSTDALVWAMTSLPDSKSLIAVYSHDEWLLDEKPDDLVLAERLHRDAEVKLAEAASKATARVPQTGSSIDVALIEIVVAGRSVLTAASATRVSQPRQIDLRVVHGDPRTTVLDVAEQEGADLLVVGAQGRTGLAGAVLGSFTSYAIHHSPPERSVVVVR